MFHIGDKLAHPGHGGCTVTDICMQKRGGDAIEYLILVPQNDPGIKVMVPQKNAQKIGIRNIISSEAADELLDSFAKAENAPEYENNFAKRRQAYQEVLKNGSLQSLVSMIQELTRQQKLSSGDQEMLPRAQRKLFSEIALAKGMEFQRVSDIASARMLPVANQAI